jgi:hypothetical protein
MVLLHSRALYIVPAHVTISINVVVICVVFVVIMAERYVAIAIQGGLAIKVGQSIATHLTLSVLGVGGCPVQRPMTIRQIMQFILRHLIITFKHRSIIRKTPLNRTFVILKVLVHSAITFSTAETIKMSTPEQLVVDTIVVASMPSLETTLAGVRRISF